MSFIGASFEAIGQDMLLLKDLACPAGLAEGDQIQKAFTDDDGLTQMKVYEYWESDGWVDPETFDYVGDTVGLGLGTGAWFISSAPKTITTSGQVKNSNAIHTFTDGMTVVSSAFPGDFCPNSANVSWGTVEGDQIQSPYTDDDGLTQMTVYEYWVSDGWVDPETFDVLDPTFAVATAGKAFWFITGSPSEVSFTETCPIK